MGFKILSQINILGSVMKFIVIRSNSISKKSNPFGSYVQLSEIDATWHHQFLTIKNVQEMYFINVFLCLASQKSLTSRKDCTELGSVAGPVIQANGRLTIEDDLRSGGILYFTTLRCQINEQGGKSASRVGLVIGFQLKIVLRLIFGQFSVQS